MQKKSPLRTEGANKESVVQSEGLKSQTTAPSLFATSQVKEAMERAKNLFLGIQYPEGYWVFDLEADTTIPAEYVLLQRFLKRKIWTGMEKRLGAYLREKQLPDGGWPLFEDGCANISASVKSYFALKLLGDSPDEDHMIRARQLILSLGGAAKVNVFTRITLALFGQMPWRTAPAMPVEIVLLPKWFFFHLDKVSYWSRAVIVPLLLLYAKRPVCRLQPEEGVRELFVEPPEKLCNLDTFAPGNPLKNLFILLDRILKRTERLIPKKTRQRAIRQALDWTLARMGGEGGIGAIFPAMANAVMALKVFGYPDDTPQLRLGIKALDELFLDCDDEACCQPCHSPIWDTCLSLSAILEAGLPKENDSVGKAVEWLLDQQVTVRGDWSNRAPDLEPGGWAFQFENNYYPDIDDTPMVLMSILRAGGLDKIENKEHISRAMNWIIGMQSSDGGWGAFDIDNNYLYLNDIPFADHGALLDPSTSDVTARCVELLSMMGFRHDFPPLVRAYQFLRREQEDFGGWFGRWGVNYIYGTWSVLMGLKRLGEDMSKPYVRKAVGWLKSCQNPDNGWGETCYTYNDPTLAGKGASTPSQTAWALLGLMAAGEVNSPAVHRGIHYLLSTQNSRGGWDEKHFTGTGFPNVFYLRYHGYSYYFPLWALGVYQRLRDANKTLQDEMSLQRPPDLRLPVLG